MSRKPKYLPISPNLKKLFKFNFSTFLLSLPLLFFILPNIVINFSTISLIILAIIFQLTLNFQIMKYSLLSGESIFVGFRRLSAIYPIYFIITTFISLFLPICALLAAHLLTFFMGNYNIVLLSISILFFFGLILSFDGWIKKLSLFFDNIFFILFFSIFVLLAIIFLSKFPLVIQSFFDWQFQNFFTQLTPGKFAFTLFVGLGGNLSFLASYFILNNSYGMAKFNIFRHTLISHTNQIKKIEGNQLIDNKKNFFYWINWSYLLIAENFFKYVLPTGLFCAALLVISVIFFNPQTDLIKNYFLIFENIWKQESLKILLFFYLAVISLLLFSQKKILENSSQIIAENFFILLYQRGESLPLSLFYYSSLWFQIIIASLFIFFINSNLMSLFNFVLFTNLLLQACNFIIVILLNNKLLASSYQVHGVKKYLLSIGGIFYLVLIILFLFTH